MLLLVPVLFVVSCASSDKQRLTNDEIRHLNLNEPGEHLSYSVTRDGDNVVRRSDHRYECQNPDGQMECYETSLTDDHRSQIQQLIDSSAVEPSELVYTEFLKGEGRGARYRFADGKAITTVCIGDQYTAAPLKLRGRCAEKVCDGLDSKRCTTKGNPDVLSWEVPKSK